MNRTVVHAIDKVFSTTYELLYGHAMYGLSINNKHAYGTDTVRYVPVCQQEMTAAFLTVRTAAL